jgi:hypothetical protein
MVDVARGDRLDGLGGDREALARKIADVHARVAAGRAMRDEGRRLAGRALWTDHTDPETGHVVRTPISADEADEVLRGAEMIGRAYDLIFHALREGLALARRPPAGREAPERV